LAFARIAYSLDNKITLPDELQINGSRGYGFSLACIPYEKGVNYNFLLFKSILSGLMHRWFKI